MGLFKRASLPHDWPSMVKAEGKIILYFFFLFSSRIFVKLSLMTFPGTPSLSTFLTNNLFILPPSIAIFTCKSFTHKDIFLNELQA